MVNRIWLHLMGNGIVRSPENFGATGQPPTHPELLDYLAVEFMENDWSVKQLIKQIVTSRSYRTSSDYDDARFEIDPKTNTLAYGAETIGRRSTARFDVGGQWSAGYESPTGLARGGIRYFDHSRRSADRCRWNGNVLDARPRKFNVAEMSMHERRDQLSKTSKGGQTNRPTRQLSAVSTYRLCVITCRGPLRSSILPNQRWWSVNGSHLTRPIRDLYFLNNEFVIQQSDAMARRLIKEADRVKDQLENAFSWLTDARQPQMKCGRQPASIVVSNQPPHLRRRGESWSSRN